MERSTRTFLPISAAEVPLSCMRAFIFAVGVNLFKFICTFIDFKPTYCQDKKWFKVQISYSQKAQANLGNIYGLLLLTLNLA
jgi:hypothetical protein